MALLSPIAPQPGRILMTVDATSDAWTHTMELSRALGTYRIEIALAVMGPAPSDLQRKEASTIPQLEMREHQSAREPREEPYDEMARVGEWLLEWEEDFVPDIIHLNGFCYADLPWSVPVLTTIGDDLFSRWHALHHRAPSASLEPHRDKIIAGIRGSDLLVAPSRARFAAFCEAYTPAPIRCTPKIIPFSRDASVITSMEKEPFILSIGCVSNEADNLATLETAAATVPWPVYLAGETDLDSKALHHLRPLGPMKEADLACRMGRAAIFVRPARYEPFGLSELEAGLAGCALVLADLPTFRETWSDSALYVPPDDPKALSKVLCRLIEERSLRLEMASRARCRANQFTPALMAESYFEAYRELMTRSAQPLAVYLSS